LSVKPNLNIPGLAVAVLALNGCATVLDEGSALAVAPYTIETYGRIVVHVLVDDKGPFPFALDTGASISVIHDRLRDKLSLQSVPEQSVIVYGAVTSGRFPLLNVGRLQIGRETWAAPRVVSMPGKTPAGRGIDGILGIDFLSQYAVGFSVRDRAIRLYAPDRLSDKNYYGWASVPLDREPIGSGSAALYFFDVEIRGARIPAIFDLGASLNMVNWPAARSIGLQPSELIGDIEFSGAMDSVEDVGNFIAEKITTNRISWEDELFGVASLPIFETMQKDERPCAVLGVGLFNQRDFIIDFTRSRVLVKIGMDEVDIFDRDAGNPVSDIASGAGRFTGVLEQHDTEPDREYAENESARRELDDAVCNRRPG
jgi:hypothetical protein